MKLTILSILVGALAGTAIAEDAVSLKHLSTYKAGKFLEGAAEIAAYDSINKRIFAVNGQLGSITVLDVADPEKPELLKNIEVGEYGKEFTCVAVHGTRVAVTVVNPDKQAPGKVLLMDTDGAVLKVFEAGALPDNVQFSPDGAYIVAANEGEPSDDYTNDPEGSVTVVDLKADKATQVRFELKEAPKDVRVFGPNASVAQDLEPEYVAISPDSKTAYVACQENNAIAVIDLESKKVKNVKGLGYKDHSKEGNSFDASNKADKVEIKPWPTLGIYQPDAITAVEIGDETYILTANEGDARDYEAYSEETRVEDLKLDPDKFPNAQQLQDEKNLGRLKTTVANGDTDGDGDHDVIYSYGARSFSIWDADLNLVWDSGDQLEQITAERLGRGFNSTGDEQPSFKNRSDDKGPEPEAATVGKIRGKHYAFIGLERQGGIMVYDITDPQNPVFQLFINSYQDDGTMTDIAPEGLVFVPAENSHTSKNLLIVSNEVSGTTAIYEIEDPLSGKEESALSNVNLRLF
ncbi:MAG: choice-of-anchor I family protein, partial [Verrucomicrobiota bacterium]